MLSRDDLEVDAIHEDGRGADRSCNAWDKEGHRYRRMHGVGPDIHSCCCGSGARSDLLLRLLCRCNSGVHLLAVLPPHAGRRRTVAATLARADTDD